jgi:hypothetical protein
MGNQFKTDHGHSGKNRSRTYRSWESMKQRTTNPKSPDYNKYGGSGITVCERWKDSFENFLHDMGERPQGKTLDRFPEKNGNYEPNNCRWGTPKQQRDNQNTYENGNRKLSNKQVRIIRHALAFGCSQRSLAKIFNVHQTTIGDIKNNKTYYN